MRLSDRFQYDQEMARANRFIDHSFSFGSPHIYKSVGPVDAIGKECLRQLRNKIITRDSVLETYGLLLEAIICVKDVIALSEEIMVVDPRQKPKQMHELCEAHSRLNDYLRQLIFIRNYYGMPPSPFEPLSMAA